MKKYHPLAAILAVLVTSAILAGCSNDSPVQPSTSDQQYFQQVVGGYDSETRDLLTSDVEALDESEEFNLMGESFQKEVAVAGDLVPFKFGRKITHVNRSIIRPATMYGDSIAIVHTLTVITGEFVIRSMTTSGTVTIRKPFTESVHRDLRFERRWDDDGLFDEDEDEHERGKHLFEWKLVAASIVNGGTAPPSTVIQSIELITPVDTFIVTNPDEYFMATKHPWKIKMPKLKNVPITLRVTITSSSPDTEVVALHHLLSDKGMRKQLFTLVSESGGTRVYEQTWFSKIKAKKKYGHLVVSVLTNASVYDTDPMVYSSTIWGIPYLPSE